MTKSSTDHFVLLPKNLQSATLIRKWLWASHIVCRIRAMWDCSPRAAAGEGRSDRLSRSGTVAGSADLLDEFRKQMTQLNWIEGKNLTIAYRYAEGKGATRLAELAAELVGLKVDVIVVSRHKYGFGR